MIKTIIVDQDSVRIDRFIANEFPELSRSKIKMLLDKGDVLCNEAQVKASYKVQGGDLIQINYQIEGEEYIPQAEDIPLDIIYEDQDLIILNKVRGMVVHPGPGHKSGTLVNALLFYAGQDLSSLGGEYRPGIVHRLDKDTSGIILVAKNNIIHRQMSELFKSQDIHREYRALVWGKPGSKSGLIDAPIGRDINNRQRMTVTPKGKNAYTHFELMENFKNHSELALKLETGRTHQIRVHLQYIGNPVIGDEVYAPNRPNLDFKGQALHACKIAFDDPRDGKRKSFEAPLPEDYLSLRQKLV